MQTVTHRCCEGVGLPRKVWHPIGQELQPATRLVLQSVMIVPGTENLILLKFACSPATSPVGTFNPQFNKKKRRKTDRLRQTYTDEGADDRLKLFQETKFPSKFYPFSVYRFITKYGRDSHNLPGRYVNKSNGLLLLKLVIV